MRRTRASEKGRTEGLDGCRREAREDDLAGRGPLEHLGVLEGDPVREAGSGLAWCEGLVRLHVLCRGCARVSGWVSGWCRVEGSLPIT